MYPLEPSYSTIAYNPSAPENSDIAEGEEMTLKQPVIKKKNSVIKMIEALKEEMTKPFKEIQNKNQTNKKTPTNCEKNE